VQSAVSRQLAALAGRHVEVCARRPEIPAATRCKACLEWRRFVDSPGSAERNDLDHDDLEVHLAFVTEEMHAPGVLYETGARRI